MKTKLKKFKVVFNFVQYSTAETIIKAKSLEDAEELADDFDAGELETNPVDGELTVESVHEV